MQGWVVVQLYRQPPVAGFLGRACVGGREFLALYIPDRLQGPFNARLFGPGVRHSMRPLQGGRAAAVAINRLVPRYLPFSQMPLHRNLRRPSARRGLN